MKDAILAIARSRGASSSTVNVFLLNYFAADVTVTTATTTKNEEVRNKAMKDTRAKNPTLSNRESLLEEALVQRELRPVRVTWVPGVGDQYPEKYQFNIKCIIRSFAKLQFFDC
jgi:hypothetical protein